MPTVETVTVGSGRDYATPQAVVDDVDTIAGSFSLTTEDVQIDAEIYADATYTGRTTVDGVTTDATRFIRFKGSSVSAKPTFQPSSGTGHVWTVLDNFCRFEDLIVRQQASPGTSDECFRLGSTSVTAEGTRFYRVDARLVSKTDTQGDVVYAGNWDLASASNPVRFYDCILGFAGRAVIHSQIFSGSFTHYWHFDHCTIFDGDVSNVGYRANDAGATCVFVIKNCLSFSGGESFWETGTHAGTLTTTGSDNNVDDDFNRFLPGRVLWAQFTDDDTLAEPTGGQDGVCILTDITGGFDDLHPVDDTDNDAIDLADGPDTDSDVQRRDFDGRPRNGATAQVGALEFVTVGSLLLTSHQRMARNVYPRF